MRRKILREDPCELRAAWELKRTGKRMKFEYKAIPIGQLVSMPGFWRTRRNAAIAKLLEESLNKMADSGWHLITSCKTANGTIFVFQRQKTE